MNKTLESFDAIMAACKTVFIRKNSDYGASWKVLRLSSITDQILIKAARIRQIEESQEQHVDDPIEDDYKGIINYSIMGIIQLDYLTNPDKSDYTISALQDEYTEVIAKIRSLLIAKNSDYGEIWRKMRISSYTDLILMKLERLKEIHNNKGEVKYSEGIESHYMDIVNYAIFALIRLNEKS